MSAARVPGQLGTLAVSIAAGLEELALAAASADPREAWVQAAALLADYDRASLTGRRRLLTTTLAWDEDERELARWLQDTGARLAAICHALGTGMARPDSMCSAGARDALARALYHTGEALKYEIAASPRTRLDFGKPHAILRGALASGCHRVGLVMPFDGRPAPCTLESLYFRVLLLARLASGPLTYRQVEILDAWMWMWMPVLASVPQAPLGGALRADLDSDHGLLRGPREDAGLSLYLPVEPLQRAYQEIVARFHAGRPVPDEGSAAQVRIEEHVAVLDLVRAGLRDLCRPAAQRAQRRPVDGVVEVFAGLGEIAGRAFAPQAPAAPTLVLADADGRSEPRRVSERDVALGEIYDAPRRHARLRDASDSGLGLEARNEGVGALAAGDLVALRMPSGALLLGKVARCVPRGAAGNLMVGVRRISERLQPARLRREAAGGREETVSDLFVPGPERDGSEDGYLVTERDFDPHARLHVVAGGQRFTLRFNRVRDRGRGWVLAGFEVVAARPEYEFLVA